MSRDGVNGIMHNAEGCPALHVRVALPTESAANAALIAWLATALGVRRSCLCIPSGERARQKVLHIDGDPAALQGSIAGLLRQVNP